MREKLTSDAVFVIDKEKVDEFNLAEEKETFYTMGVGGRAQTEMFHTNRTCAKKVVRPSIDKNNRSIAKAYYYIRVENGFLYNPRNLYAKETIPAKQIFQNVNEECFNYYLKFLGTENSAWLTNAQRVI